MICNTFKLVSLCYNAVGQVTSQLHTTLKPKSGSKISLLSFSLPLLFAPREEFLAAICDDD